MKVGIFGGSFDPIHNGHIRLAQYVLDHTDLDEVWLMVSPLNPLKPQGYVASDAQRLAMARIAVKGISGIKVSDFEFSLQSPSFTYNTLTKLKDAYPDIDFCLIIGGDNWTDFEKWKSPDKILKEFGVIVYPRPGEILRLQSENGKWETEHLTLLDSAPEMPVSSTGIRKFLQSRTREDGMHIPQDIISVPSTVLDYIKSNNLYFKSM